MPTWLAGEPMAYMDMPNGAFMTPGGVYVLGDWVFQNHVLDSTDKAGNLQSAAVGGAIYLGQAGAPLGKGDEVEWDSTKNAGQGGWVPLAGGKRYGFVEANGLALAEGDIIRVLHWPGKDGMGGGGPTIPMGSVDLGPSVDTWVPFDTQNPNEDDPAPLAPYDFAYNRPPTPLFTYTSWHFTVPATGDYVFDATDVANPGDRFELYWDIGSGEVSSGVTSNTVPSKCDALNESNPEVAWASGNFSSIAGIALTNSTTYVFRLKLIDYAQDFLAACDVQLVGTGWLRIRDITP